MKEEKEKRIDTKKEKEIKTGDVTMHETEESADVFPEKTGDNLIFLDDPKLRKEYLDCMRYLLTQIAPGAKSNKVPEVIEKGSRSEDLFDLLKNEADKYIKIRKGTVWYERLSGKKRIWWHCHWTFMCIQKR